MKPVFKKRFAFITKSMLWSVLLYVVLMLVFNWDDVSNRVKGANAITIMSNIPSPQSFPVTNPVTISPSISHNISVIDKAARIAKEIICVVAIATH